MTVKSCRVLDEKSNPDLESYDAVLLTLPELGQSMDEVLEPIPAELKDAIMTVAKRADCKGKSGDSLSFDLSPTLRVGVVFTSEKRNTFQSLSDARELLGKVKDGGAKNLLLDLRFVKNAEGIADVFTSALVVQDYKFKKYGTKESKQEKDFQWDVVGHDSDALSAVVKKAQATAEATNLVRHLSLRAGNDLTPETYINDVRDMAKEWNVDVEFYDFDRLLDMKAGAFIAVAQGSPEHDAGILKLSYEPDGASKHLVLVGKGITYDTGGTNLKSAGSMFGMHGDMGGSALALASFQLAVKEAWPYRVTCYLAISDNSIGDRAYRPNDVVVALNGKSIEVVHTDAEGRMVLADTLHLASKEKADLMLDFATLTGACVGAIGTTYSGAFTNRDDLHSLIIEAGRKSGERVWPFPLDEDFGECLKSDIADLKQCRVSGGVDHIEAAYFLKEFVDDSIPWIHIDLAASENSGGLAHVGTECTGYGVRLVSQITQDFFSK
ncbi:M17 family metallopeptidase [Pseudobacteriovorax antillogorgiicola]|uniref:Leucyl aminopeptidase n=1 Tax=Pseudobacteriovorax antillogorgiicola TaxID=1513793 RepID=A0A1Y6C963_9BACT|nr:leucyl aminopeptidase family protein [Pseudobacteriovorax antillogorgiicola]TCS50724.1 leucyl aminopeptidase [Pseudobacteriovorax antillogorgiicola]SMF40835.1 leucyl aminopeptidase [Pseudobacteriovorax antillogorgiicola]